MSEIPPDREFRNVVCIVGDAVRWEESHEELKTLGPTVKTVAASLHTPTSFASMFTGVHPRRHGVFGFDRRVPRDVPSLFDTESHTVAFGPGSMNDWLATRQQLFGEVDQTPLASVEEPFLWVTRDGGGHAPYDGFDETGQEYAEETAKEYLTRNAGDIEQLRADYRRGITSFLDRVRQCLGRLEERGIREETLVVVTSDHGELLGEHGQVGHDVPPAPELVYVPTTFLTPGLEAELPTEELMRHVDLAPTLAGLLGESVDIGECDGRDLTREEPATTAVNHYGRSFADFLKVASRTRDWNVADRVDSHIPDLRAEYVSLWDRTGGYSRNCSRRTANLLVPVIRLAGTPEGKHVRSRRSYRRYWRTLTNRWQRWGSPVTAEATAKEQISAYRSGETGRGTRRELGATSRDQLEDLGYL